MSEKHRPGPWYLIIDHDGDEFHSGDWAISDANNDLFMGYTAYYPWQSERIEDARLISAAPELLEACERAEWWLTTIEGSEAIISVLRGAIAKAEGRS